MKYANKIHATYVLVLGGNELEQQSAKLKQMETGEQIAIPLDDRFAEAFEQVSPSHMFQNTLQEEKAQTDTTAKFTPYLLLRRSH